MDHIRQHDWCSMRPGRSFVDEVDLDNCVTERILRNKFYDPMVSSDDDQPVEPIDWDDIFKKKIQIEQGRKFIPGFHKPPPHPKLSALTQKEHFHCIKVLAAKNPHVMPGELTPHPNKLDFKVFEEIAEKYAKEQKEFIEWAKTIWVTSNCIRALRPKPIIETVYEAEFQMKVHALQSFPKTYSMAAQIPIGLNNHSCEIILPNNELVKVNISDLPEVEYPHIIKRRTSILQACPVPEPCTKHPCRFQLPNESTESILPLTEIHKELAQYALDNGSTFIASENALKCLLQMDKIWTIPVSVREGLNLEGEKSIVVVLGSEVYVRKHLAVVRSYRAYRHLLLQAFTSLESKAKAITARGENLHKNTSDNTQDEIHRTSREFKEMQLKTRNRNSTDNGSVSSGRNSIEMCSADGSLKENSRNSNMSQFDDDSSDDDRLLIDIAGEIDTKQPKKTKRARCNSNTSDERSRKAARITRQCNDYAQKEHDDLGLFTCVCKGTEFETPPPRSFRNCKIKNSTTNEEYGVIIHCSHKLRDDSGEVILEPIPEYQLDIGGTLHTQDQLRALELALMLRSNASLINVRIDSVSGDLVTIEKLNQEQFTSQHGSRCTEIANIFYTTLNQLAPLLPGDYLLHHEPTHGPNAMLYTSSRSDVTLTLQLDQQLEADEAKMVQVPPNLGPVLLPVHKARHQLPCAFTTTAGCLAREPQKPATRRKLPPRALTWPKKKKKKNKKK